MKPTKLSKSLFALFPFLLAFFLLRTDIVRVNLLGLPPMGVVQTWQIAIDGGTELKMAYEEIKQKDNPLKLKAYFFLVENMKEQYGYDYREDQQFDALIDKIIETRNDGNKKNDFSDINKYKSDSIGSYRLNRSKAVQRDVDYITSDFLVKHIDFAFERWNSKWCSHLTFDEFCYLMLPYRFGHEKLEDWSAVIEHSGMLSDTLRLDTCTALEAAQILNKIAHNTVHFTTFLTKALEVNDVPASDLVAMDWGSCFHQTIIKTMLLRYAGIPSGVVKGKGTHFWNVIKLEDGSYVDFNWLSFGKPREGKEQSRSVYINNEGHRYSNQENTFLLSYKPNIPEESSGVVLPDDTRFSINISDSLFYNEDCIVDLPYPTKRGSKVYLYHLKYLTGKHQSPIAFGIVEKGNKVRFKNVFVGELYVVKDGEKEGSRFISDAFIHLPQGRKKYFIPQTDSLVNIRVTRKANRTKEFVKYSKSLWGAVIEGANNAGFLHCDSIGVLGSDSADAWIDVEISSTEKHKYYRIRPNKLNKMNIAEIQWIKQGGEQMLGKPFTNRDEKGRRVRKSMDNDIRTNFVGWTNEWLGLKSDTAWLLQGLKILPRNNFNVIEAGNDYELFIYDKGWKSWDRRIAGDETVLEYEVPYGALFYLANHTQGVQQKIFIYKEGKQIWHIPKHFHLTNWVLLDKKEGLIPDSTYVTTP